MLCLMPRNSSLRPTNAELRAHARAVEAAERDAQQAPSLVKFGRAIDRLCRLDNGNTADWARTLGLVGDGAVFNGDDMESAPILTPSGIAFLTGIATERRAA